jgi:hypothetical protein
MPMSFRSLDEVDYVGDKLHPGLNSGCSPKAMSFCSGAMLAGYASLPNSDSAPDDVRKLKIFSWVQCARV